MAPIYIDEDVGKDEPTASGATSSPYKTLAYAMVQHSESAEEPQYMTRKSETGPVSEDGDPAARLEWKPATKSALKKATNLAEQQRKKAAKAQELAFREKEEKEKRQQVLETAKNVVV